MFEIAWTEFNRRDELVTKTKEFISEKAREAFVAKLTEKNNFHKILGYRGVEENG